VAVTIASPAVGRLATALGLERCRRATITLGVDEVVMVTAEQYAEGDQLNRVSLELETNKYVVITQNEYEKLKSDAMLAARERKGGSQ